MMLWLTTRTRDTHAPSSSSTARTTNSTVPTAGACGYTRRKRNVCTPLPYSLSSLSSPLDSTFHYRCYCCDQQAPCADWAVHCDAKAGVARWVNMRRQIQSARASAGANATAGRNTVAGAGNPVSLQPPAPRSGAAAGAEASQRANDPDYLTSKPPDVEAMPDPSTIPNLRLLGTLNLPVLLLKGHTATQLDAKLAAQRFGLRFRDHSVKSMHSENQGYLGSKARALYNLFNLFQDDSNRGGKNTYMRLTPLYRPEDPPQRKTTPFRVVVVDTSGNSAPVEIAVNVQRNGNAGDIVAAIRAHCNIPVKEKVILAHVELNISDRSTLAKYDGRMYYNGNSGNAEIKHLYTSEAGDGGKSAMAKSASSSVG